jgi:UDP-N-acetylglucosamine 4-epimerase
MTAFESIKQKLHAQFISGGGETSCDFCFVNNAVQANLLAATVQTPEALNQVYNMAVGNRTTLNELYAQLKANLLPLNPPLQNTVPVYRDFRSDDVPHSLTDVSKATTRLGYVPTQRIGQGIELAKPWYIQLKA